MAVYGRENMYEIILASHFANLTTLVTFSIGQRTNFMSYD